MASRRNIWPFGDSTKTTTVYHRRGASFARGANYKGYRVWEDENGWHTSLDPGSWFDSQRDAKNLIDSWEKDRKNPRNRKNILPLSSLASGAGSASGILGPSEKWLKKHRLMPNVTDRAHRYRAQKAIPEGEKRCNLCGRPRDVEVGHVNGHEEDTEPINLFWTCRSCNVLAANTMRRAGVGRLTHQYNPQGGAKSVGQWLTAVTSMKGENGAMSVPDAVAMIRATSPAKRSEYAAEIWKLRKGRGNPMRRRNPEAESAEGFEAFHGFRPTEQITIEKDVHYHSELWAIGELIKLIVVSPDGIEVDITGFKGAMLSANEANTQLYIEGGDQTVNLSDFGLGEPYHDKEDLGEVKKLFYFTNKTHLGDQGGEAVYHHKLGEEGTKRNYEFGKLEGRKVPRPRLAYDVVNQALEFIGGEYVIEPEGIRN